MLDRISGNFCRPAVSVVALIPRLPALCCVLFSQPQLQDRDRLPAGPYIHIHPPVPSCPLRCPLPPPPSSICLACRARHIYQLVLTTKEFPSFFFIAISQFTSTCLVLSLLNVTGHIKVRPATRYNSSNGCQHVRRLLTKVSLPATAPLTFNRCRHSSSAHDMRTPINFALSWRSILLYMHPERWRVSMTFIVRTLLSCAGYSSKAFFKSRTAISTFLVCKLSSSGCNPRCASKWIPVRWHSPPQAISRKQTSPDRSPV